MSFDDGPARVLGGLYGGGVAGMPYITLWFISTLFFTAVLFRLIERLPLVVQWVLGIAGAVAGWIGGSVFSDSPLGIGLAVTSLIYLLIGDGLRRIRARLPAPAVIGVVLIAVSTVLIATGASSFLDMKQGDFGTPVLSLLVAAAISIGMILIAESVVRPGRFSQLCTLLALPLLTVVLMHPIFLWTPWPDWLTFIAAMLVPLLVGLVALRTPASPWLTGQPAVRARSGG
jgi:hypothetical protein